MEKRCFSVKAADFEKSAKALGKPKLEKLLERIKKLEDMENDVSLLPQGMKSAEIAFGKSLVMNKNIYVLEMGHDRAMAVIIEKENKKIYAWFWAGSHEEYNKKLKAKTLGSNESSVVNTQTPVITTKLKEMKEEEKKQVEQNISTMREDSKNHWNNGNNNYHNTKHKKSK